MYVQPGFLSRVGGAMLIGLIAAGPAWADVAFYTIPGTRLEVLLRGSTKIHPGGTATVRHPRGSLHFNARDLRVVKLATPASAFAVKRRDATKQGSVDALLELAKWSLRHGMLDQSKELLGEAWKLDSENQQLRYLAGLMRYVNQPASESPSEEKRVRDLIGGHDMKRLRSKHFLLLYDGEEVLDPITRKTRAQMRSDLLEKVYESFFLTFAFRGKYIKPPTEPMVVVLFSDHADFMLMERRLEMSLRQTAGFYLPSEDVSMFYDSGTSPAFQALNGLSQSLANTRQAAIRNRSAASGDVIRFAKTLELLIDIQRESDDVSVVSHEAVHHLAAATGLFRRDGRFIRWVHEGLASYFESAKMAQWSGVGNIDADRLGYYRLLQPDPVRGSLEFIVSDLGFVVEEVLGNQLPAYGQAWALTHFLFDRHFDGLMAFYERLGELSEGKDMKISEHAEEMLAVFDEVFPDRAGLEIEWRRYMRTLRTDMEQLAMMGR
ncbi:MAG: DUF1570 domain-containing protein [Planctomycetota bacterium]